MMLEEDGVYIGHIQWRIYRTMPEEEASTAQAATVGGPLPGANLGAQEIHPKPAICKKGTLQGRSI